MTVATAHRILSAAALRPGAAAAAAPAATATPPGTAPLVVPPNAAPAPAAAAAPAAPAPDGTQPVDVVTVADAQAAVAEGEARGATAERERTSKVLASASAQKNGALAAFMLQHNPTATADAIIAHLDATPAPAAAAPAPTAPAAPAPAALTHDLSQTPLITVAPAAHSGSPEGMSQADQEKFWDAQMGAASASISQPFGGDIAPGVPRTGN